MMPHNDEESLAVFTAGFSSLTQDRFWANLRAYDIQLLVDVRSRPFSGRIPHFDRERIGPAALAAGFDYRYMGQELGGLPDGADFYDAAGYVLYHRIATQPWFEQGIQRVLFDLRQGKRLALACVEDDPRQCHRRLLLGRVLREQGIGVAHILADGGLIAEAELQDEERLRRHGQFSGEPEPEWKSARPLRGSSSQ